MEGIPERVLSLIEKSGETRRDFARAIELDESKLSKSLSGARRFTSTDLAYIGDHCDVSVDWLITGEMPELALAARTTTGQARTAVEAAEDYRVMRDDLSESGWKQPWRPLPGELPGGTYADQGAALAERALERVAAEGLSVATDDLPELVEEVFGADVAVVALDDGFDGLAASSDTAKLIVLGTSQVPARQRFTLAHELGHLLMADDQGAHLDENVYDKAQMKDPSEKRANAFASAFLMPADVLRSAVGTTGLTREAFAALACDLNVSPSTLAFRLEQLRLIDGGAVARFRRITGAEAATLSGRSEEFAQRMALASTPRLPGLILRDTYNSYEIGESTLRPYANLLGVDVDELRQSLESDEGVPGV